MADVVAEIGWLGGPGLGALLEHARTVEVHAPSGAPLALDGVTPDLALP